MAMHFILISWPMRSLTMRIPSPRAAPCSMSVEEGDWGRVSSTVLSRESGWLAGSQRVAAALID